MIAVAGDSSGGVSCTGCVGVEKCSQVLLLATETQARRGESYQASH